MRNTIKFRYFFRMKIALGELRENDISQVDKNFYTIEIIKYN